jgi:hypothetical protein
MHILQAFFFPKVIQGRRIVKMVALFSRAFFGNLLRDRLRWTADLLPQLFRL